MNNESTWDNQVTLIGTEGYTEDDLGQQIQVEKTTTVFCCKKPVTRQEFYLARQNDIQISEVLVVHPYEYNGENYVMFEGNKLKVLKTYIISQEELELTCTEKVGDRSGTEN